MILFWLWCVRVYILRILFEDIYFFFLYGLFHKSTCVCVHFVCFLLQCIDFRWKSCEKDVKHKFVVLSKLKECFSLDTKLMLFICMQVFEHSNLSPVCHWKCVIAAAISSASKTISTQNGYQVERFWILRCKILLTIT